MKINTSFIFDWTLSIFVIAFATSICADITTTILFVDAPNQTYYIAELQGFVMGAILGIAILILYGGKDA